MVGSSKSGQRNKRFDYPPRGALRFSEAALTEGVEEHRIDGVTVRIIRVAGTLADGFKSRRKIGLGVALEVFKEALEEAEGQGDKRRRVGLDSLWRCAWLDRVADVMRPYLESLA